MEKLTEYMTKHSLTQLKAAELFGISRSYLAEILNGKPPGRETIRKIDEATGGAVPPGAWFAKASADQHG